MSLRRIDARFLLPRPPRTALVLGDLEPWRDGLGQEGVDVSPAGGRPPDLAVAPGAMAREALATGAPMIVLEGPAPRGLGASGLATRRLLARPTHEQPSLLLPVDDPVASRYAVERWSVLDRRWKVARMLVARELMRRRRFPNVGTPLTLAVRGGGDPFMLAGARARLGLPPGVRPLLALGQGDTLSRNAFHLFPSGAVEPAWVLKFARVRGYAAPFDGDERGLGIAARAGGPVAARAPRLLGRLEEDGIHASLESAAAGTRMRDILLRPGGRRRKLELIEMVAGWIIEVGRVTASPAERLTAERRRLTEDVLPAWAGIGARRDLVEVLPPVPAVVQHNDLGSWNIVVGPTGFIALDWESAREHGLPLWDLFYFLADALALVDGSTAGAERHRHTVRLFRGDLASSRILFRWTRRAATAAGVPADAVEGIATLCWLHHSLSHVSRASAIDAHAHGSLQPIHGTENVAAAWLADPALRNGWRQWRQDDR